MTTSAEAKYTVFISNTKSRSGMGLGINLFQKNEEELRKEFGIEKSNATGIIIVDIMRCTCKEHGMIC